MKHMILRPLRAWVMFALAVVMAAVMFLMAVDVVSRQFELVIVAVVMLVNGYQWTALLQRSHRRKRVARIRALEHDVFGPIHGDLPSLPGPISPYDRRVWERWAAGDGPMPQMYIAESLERADQMREWIRAVEDSKRRQDPTNEQ